MKRRSAKVARKTRETDITVELDIDGGGLASIRTGIGFMDHMLELLAKHSLIDLSIQAVGDRHVDDHHTVEDVGLALGEALNEALGERKGLARYGWSMVPMDDCLAAAAVDLGGRPYLVFEVNNKRKIKGFDAGLIEEFFRALCVQARMNLHVAHLYGKDPHHAYESMFKAVAKALGIACARDARVTGVPSSKGTI